MLEECTATLSVLITGSFNIHSLRQRLSKNGVKSSIILRVEVKTDLSANHVCIRYNTFTPSHLRDFLCSINETEENLPNSE